MNAPALLLIDVQEGFHDSHWGPRNNPQAEARISEALAHWRAQGWPVIHIRHLSRDPGSPLCPSRPGVAFMDFATPHAGEPVFEKDVNSAFIGTGLERHLRERGLRRLVIAGFSTDHCVSTSTRMAGNLGFETTVLEDATATFDRFGPDVTRYSAETVHHVTLASLNGEFARITTLARTIDQELALRTYWNNPVHFR